MSDCITLYAEDDENDVFFLQRAFKLAGITDGLQVVPDGQLAVDYLAGVEGFSDRARFPMPCLVLLDLNMPGKSGLDVLAWIRAQSGMTTLPVVILTSSNQESDIERAYGLGANDYLIKPGKPGELLEMVKKLKVAWLTTKPRPTA